MVICIYLLSGSMDLQNGGDIAKGTMVIRAQALRISSFSRRTRREVLKGKMKEREKASATLCKKRSICKTSGRE
jgi:hypothetical protein